MTDPVTNYSKAPYFENYEDYFREMYSKKWLFLTELCSSFIHDFTEKIGIKTKVFPVSSPEEWPDDPNQRLVSIVKKLGGDAYLAGAGGRNYLDETHKLFHHHNQCINICFMMGRDWNYG